MSDIESKQVKKPSLGRRKFLTKTAAAAVVGAIPARSVWATGVTNSIMASGHGSDFAFNKDLKLLGPCEILRDFSTHTFLQLKFSDDVFGGISTLTFYNILECYCCPVQNSIPGISNVVFLLKDGTKVKIEDYYSPSSVDITDPRHPHVFFDHFSSSNPVKDYVIKAGQGCYTSKGVLIPKINNSYDHHTWYRGFNGVTTIQGASPSSLASIECDEKSALMVTVFLNAILDLEARNGAPATESWEETNGIYYPILKTADDADKLAESISNSADQLSYILSSQGVSLDKCCPTDPTDGCIN